MSMTGILWTLEVKGSEVLADAIVVKAVPDVYSRFERLVRITSRGCSYAAE
jgi:hypothetical protein